MINQYFPGKKLKALTFSFDDGVMNDLRFAKLLNKYGMKATFNINTGKMTSDSKWIYKETIVSHLTFNEMKEAYKGHEIASHTFSHPFPDRIDYKTYSNEVSLDITIIEKLFERKVVGFAYPYGTATEEGVQILKENNIKYARTVGETMKFDIPEDLLRYPGTCHFKNSKLMDLAKEFIELKPNEKKLFYIWGHTYEFITEEDWEHFEEFLKLMKAHENEIFFGSNKEVFIGGKL